MSDTIDRQAAIEAFSCCDLTPDGGIDANYAIDILKQLPPAQPEIIRCKDCVHSDTFPEGADNDTPLKCLGIRYGGVMPDWYCEHAERRRRGMNDFAKMYVEFERKYNPYPVQMSRAEAFSHALEDGLIDEETYHAAHDYYGPLWFYVGD